MKANCLEVADYTIEEWSDDPGTANISILDEEGYTLSDCPPDRYRVILGSVYKYSEEDGQYHHAWKTSQLIANTKFNSITKKNVAEAIEEIEMKNQMTEDRA